MPQNIALQKEIEARLGQYRDAYLDKDLISARAVKQVKVDANTVNVDIVLGYPVDGIRNTMEQSIRQLIEPILGGRQYSLRLSAHIDAHVGKQGIPALPRVKNIIAVGSGKGGVGKSTVAVNLALALAKEGSSVGLLDADIYGPSQPSMLGAENIKPVIKDKRLYPVVRHGIQSMSIGYLVDANAPMVWRGPMIGKAMQQMLHDTEWDALDYLIVDLPPGTGDVQLTLCQKIPVSGALIVTTPQDLALLDVRRACEMFNKLDVPILGIIENMQVYHCPKCGHEENIFGQGGGEKLTKEYGISLLGKIPLAISIREMTDNGHPPVAQTPDSVYAKHFCEIARKVAAKLSLRNKDYSARFPKVVVE